MTGDNGNLKDPKSADNLERWLQLPDSYHDDDESDHVTPENADTGPDDSPAPVDDSKSQGKFLEDLDEAPHPSFDLSFDSEKSSEDRHDETEPVSEADSDTPGLFDTTGLRPVVSAEAEVEVETTDEELRSSDDVIDQELPDEESVEYEHSHEYPPPSEDEDKDEVEVKNGEESPSKSDRTVEVDRLQDKLGFEFRDTLTGANAYTFPIALVLLILTICGFFYKPLLALFGFDDVFAQYRVWILGGAGIFALAGLHLLLYWLFHRISNSIKSRELDKLIENRRFLAPCDHLDCVEIENPDPDADTGELEWECSYFDLSLDGSLICAVCDNYESTRNVEIIEKDGN